MMLKTFLAAASLSAAVALGTAPAGAMPLGGGAIDVPTSAQNVQWYDDDGPRWHRRGPPPWARAWGHRRHRHAYRYYGGPRYYYGGPRYRSYYGERPYYRRPGLTLRFGY